MLKSFQLHTRHTHRLTATAVVFLMAIALFLPVQAGPTTQRYEAMPPPNYMPGGGLVGRSIMSSPMCTGDMGAMMDQMTPYMHGTPMSGMMPIAGAMRLSRTTPMTGQMSMTEMGWMMHRHMGRMRTTMGPMMSTCMMESGMIGAGLSEKNTTPMPTAVAPEADPSRHGPKSMWMWPHHE